MWIVRHNAAPYYTSIHPGHHTIKDLFGELCDLDECLVVRWNMCIVAVLSPLLRRLMTKQWGTEVLRVNELASTTQIRFLPFVDYWMFLVILVGASPEMVLQKNISDREFRDKLNLNPPKCNKKQKKQHSRKGHEPQLLEQVTFPDSGHSQEILPSFFCVAIKRPLQTFCSHIWRIECDRLCKHTATHKEVTLTTKEYVLGFQDAFRRWNF